MSVTDGKVALYHRHCQRITEDASRLGIPLDKPYIAERIAKEAHQLGNGVLKCLVSAGEGGRGYTRPEQIEPELHFSTAPLPPQYAKQQHHGITLGRASLSLSLQPALAGIKHLNRLEQVLLKRELAQHHAGDLVVLDASGNVAEATAANLFWRSSGRWFTPALEQCGVRGVMRDFLLDWLSSNGQEVAEGNYPLHDVVQAESVMLCNALMPIIPVSSLDTGERVSHYSLTPVQELFQAIQKSFREEYAPAN